MFYSMLGRAVWYGLKLFMRRKFGPTYLPKSLLAGGTVAVAIAVTVAVLRARSSSDT